MQSWVPVGRLIVTVPCQCPAVSWSTHFPGLFDLCLLLSVLRLHSDPPHRCGYLRQSIGLRLPFSSPQLPPTNLPPKYLWMSKGPQQALWECSHFRELLHQLGCQLRVSSDLAPDTVLPLWPTHCLLPLHSTISSH